MVLLTTYLLKEHEEVVPGGQKRHFDGEAAVVAVDCQRLVVDVRSEHGELQRHAIHKFKQDFGVGQGFETSGSAVPIVQVNGQQLVANIRGKHHELQQHVMQ